MADDTGTDPAAVAEEIVGWSCTDKECDHHECKFMRAAAVSLAAVQQLVADRDRLRDAVAAHHDCCCTDLWPELRDEP